MSDSDDGAYDEHEVEFGRARVLIARAVRRPRALLRKLVIGDVIGERPDAALPPHQRRRK